MRPPVLPLLLITLLCTCGRAQIQAQEQELNTPLQRSLDSTFQALDAALSYGDSTALWTLAGLLDDQRPFKYTMGYHGTQTTKVSNIARQHFYRYLELDSLKYEEEITGSNLTQYLQKHAWTVSFSPLLGKYIDVPLEHRQVAFQVRELPPVEEQESWTLQELREELADAVADKEWYYTTNVIKDTGDLATPEAFNFLQQCAAGQHWGRGDNERENQVYSAILYALRNFPSLEAARLASQILNDQEVYSRADGLIALAKITNVDFAWLTQQDSLIEPLYTQLFDSLQTLPAIRTAGYHLLADFTEDDYETRLDFLTTLAVGSSSIWWINYHALHDLLATHDPAALPVVASQLKRGVEIYNDHFGREEYNVVEMMEAATGIRLEVRDRNGQFTNTYQDEVSQTN